MKRLFSTLFFLSLLLVAEKVLAQPYFQRYDSIDVKLNSTFVLNPWAGGLNFTQSSAIDMNMDGIKDLFIFDKSGDKGRTYINRGTANMVDYKYDAYYESRFPEMTQWTLLYDYDGDGKEDIFTYSYYGGGFDVYKNISTIATGLQFQLVKLQQKSIYNPDRTNTTSGPIPDGFVSGSWDGTGISGPTTFLSRTINCTNLNAAYWKLMSITLNISHPNASDVIVYVINPSGQKIRLIRNVGGSGDNFTQTVFSPYSSNNIGTSGFNTAPFTGTYAPEETGVDWAAFMSGNPNGLWKLQVGDQATGNAGTLLGWSLNFYSPNFTPFTTYSPTNLYVSSVDIPALTDVDNDGDMDVVTFFSGGTYLEWHQNLSQEIYGHSDSLIFSVKNHCWGYASEAVLSNDYTLHDTCINNVYNPGIITHETDGERSNERHTGSCELCLDLDNDGDKEFVVGDVSFPTLTMLTNGGTPSNANFIAVDTAFPANTSSTAAIDLTLFPCAFYLDLNNDGLKDLVVSPSAPNASENFNSQVYYQNTGTTTSPVFDYQQSNFLQDNMIDVGEGAYPVFFDYNADGLKDMFIGNYNYYNVAGAEHKVAQFMNIGTATAPKFELITRNYNNMSSIGITNMVLTFGDMDADGDDDMFVGGYDGRIHYFTNIAGAGAPANFVLSIANYKNSNSRTIDVGDFATPQIFDVDNDGKNDLVIGGKNGKVAYYHHIGSPTASAPSLDSVSHFFGNFKVNQPGYFTGYAHPFMFRQGGQTKLLCGTELGYLRLYDNIDGNLSGTFTLSDSTFMGTREGGRTAPFATDMNNDGFMDLIVGNYQGGVSYFKGVSSISTANDIDQDAHWNIELFPNPANNSFTLNIVNDNQSDYKIELYNVVGQVIYSTTSSEKVISLSTDNYTPGIYLCKVTEFGKDHSVKGELTKRIVIQH